MACPVSIVVVAKVPVAGKSKTRLIPKFGEDGSAKLARAMLLDVLTCLSDCVSLFVRLLCYSFVESGRSLVDLSLLSDAMYFIVL